MDMLVVAAAAGAGCLAKYWQDVLGDRGIRSGASGDAFAQSGGNSGINGSGFSSSTNEGHSQKRVVSSEENSLLSRRTQRRFGDPSGEPESLASLDVHQHVGTLSWLPDLEKGGDCRNRVGSGDGSDHVSQEFASTSGLNIEPLMTRVRREGYGSSHLPGSQSKDGDGCEELNDGHNALDKSGRYGPDLDETENVLSNEFSPRISDGRHRFCRNRSLLQRRWSHGYSMKPMTALESCLVAQLYREPVEMEEYVFSSPRSPSAGVLRPFIVTKDNQIFSSTAENDQQHLRLPSGLCADRLGYGSELLDNGHTLTGIPPLPAAGSKDSQRKEKQQRKKVLHGEVNASSATHSKKDLRSQGSIDAVLLFCFGIGVGVMSTILSSKREVNKLNELLKQTENLVQDLQEELEMKDSLTVKELASEPCISPERTSRKCSIKKATKSSTSKEPDECCDHIEDEIDMPKTADSESMSKIEAELEAELERLELNMSGFGHKRRLSGLSELDPDCMVDIVQGELRADVVAGERSSEESNLDASSSTSTPMHRSDYAVSPRELSLRLHQVIQSRLEERIAELETALQHSQKRLDAVENQESRSLQLQAGFSSSDISPTPFESPTIWTYQAQERLDFAASSTKSATDEEDHNSSVRPLRLNLSGDALDAYNDAFDEFIKMAESERQGTQMRDAVLQEAPNLNGLTDLHESWPDVEEQDEEDSKLLIKHILEKNKGKLSAKEARKMLLSFEDMSSE
ncbi:uncharacterized protein LOC116257424 [Nymphaea colorata]|nr:uncharacterized protein LOC116257424 [Nymphaea colorata]